MSYSCDTLRTFREIKRPGLEDKYPNPSRVEIKSLCLHNLYLEFFTFHELNITSIERKLGSQSHHSTEIYISCFWRHQICSYIQHLTKAGITFICYWTSSLFVLPPARLLHGTGWSCSLDCGRFWVWPAKALRIVPHGYTFAVSVEVVPAKLQTYME
jgi:hypothetical protein